MPPDRIYREVYAKLPVPVLIVGPPESGGAIIDANELCLQAVGLQRDELAGMTLAKVFYLESDEKTTVVSSGSREKTIGRVLQEAERTGSVTEETKALLARPVNGGKRENRTEYGLHITPLEPEDGGTGRFLITLLDRSDSNSGNFANTGMSAPARNSNATATDLHKIVNQASNLFYAHDIEGVFIYLSPKTREFFGFSPEESLRNWTEFISDHPANRKAVEYTDRAIATGEVQPTYEVQLRKADGSFMWAQVNEAPLLDNGKVIGISGSLTDITERKHAEERLRETNEKLNIAHKIAKMGYWEHHIESGELYWSDQIYEIFEVDRETYRPDTALLKKTLHPDDLPGFEIKLRQAYRGEIEHDVEYRIVLSDGTVKWMHEKGAFLTDENGRPVWFKGTIQDITDMKLLETELMERIREQQCLFEISLLDDRNLTIDELLQQAVERIPDGFYHADKACALIRWKERVFTSREFEESPLGLSGSSRPIRGERLIVEIYYCGNGTPAEGHSFLKEEDRLLESIIGLLTMKVEKLIQNRELEEQKQFIETTLDNLPIGVAVHTIDEGKNTLMNRRFSWIYGWPPEEIKDVETFFEKVYPNEEYRQMVKMMVMNDISSGDPARMIWNGVEITTRSGERRFVNAKNIPLEEQGLMISTVQNVTDQKRRDDELLASLKEKEILLAEIHHRVKNNLAVVSSLMELQIMNSEQPELNSQLIKAMLRVRSIATIHEQLYSSDSFSKLDLAKNIETLVSKVISIFQQKTSINATFDCEAVDLNINQAIPCTLIVNEVITNIIKHAFPGRNRGKIHIRLSEEKSGVRLEIEDNGAGLPEDFNSMGSKSLGLQLIDLLSKQLHADYRYDTTKEGTRFSLQFIKAEIKGSGGNFVL